MSAEGLLVGETNTKKEGVDVSFDELFELPLYLSSILYFFLLTILSSLSHSSI